MRKPDPEHRLLQQLRDGSIRVLERALLELSGLKTLSDLSAYRLKIGVLFSRFLDRHDHGWFLGQRRPPGYLHREIAQSLFEYLWTSKPRRFGEHFLLADVVDAQMSPDPHLPVGTCVGLTSLFSVLALRGGLHLSLLASPEHLMSRLRVGEEVIDMDHTDPQGFDCRGASGMREYSLPLLTASVLNCRGLKQEASGSRSAARSDYEKALWVHPDYANGWNNRGNMKFWEGDMAGAIEDYTEAVRLEPCFAEAYCNRGMTRQRMGRHAEARRDYLAALRVKPEYPDARQCLDSLDRFDARPR